MALLNFQPIQYISPTQAASAATFARPIKANFEALTSTDALSGSALIGVSLSPTNYSQTGNSVFDHLTGINTKFGTLNAVTLTASSNPTNYTKFTSSIEGHLKGIDTALGLKQAILTSSADLASAINDETGTGVVVFSNSPVLTGTLSVSAIKISGGATSGYVYVSDSVGVGRWVSPSSVTVTKMGTTTRGTQSSGTETIAHGLGFVPKQITFHYKSGLVGSSNEHTDGYGCAIPGISNTCVYRTVDSGGTSNTTCIYARNSTDGQTAVVSSWDATNFVITWTKVGAGFGTYPINVMWTASS